MDEPYIIEFTSYGNTVKVTAIDPQTGREVSMVGAAGVSRNELSRLAVRKLEYVLKKENHGPDA